ncbi:ASB3, partial [Symbiodinium sp. KB8]
MGNVQIAEALIRAGAYLEAQNQFGETPLNVAASHGQAKVAALLMSQGANANSQACENGHAIVVRALLQNGAEPDLQGKLGGAPLHAVAIRGLTKIAKLLILAGANVNAAQAVSDVCLGLGWMDAAALGRLEWPLELVAITAEEWCQCQDGCTPYDLLTTGRNMKVSEKKEKRLKALLRKAQDMSPLQAIAAELVDFGDTGMSSDEGAAEKTNSTVQAVME